MKQTGNNSPEGLPSDRACTYLQIITGGNSAQREGSVNPQSRQPNFTLARSLCSKRELIKY